MRVRLGLAALVFVLSRDEAAAGVNRWTSTGPDDGGGIVAVDPRDPMHLYVGTRGFGVPVFESPDGGEHWNPSSDGISAEVFRGGVSIRHLVIDRTRPDVLYAATYDGHLYRSLDGASTWFRMPNPPGRPDRLTINALALDPVDGDRLYVSVIGGLWRSDDGGGTWTSISLGLGDPTGRLFSVLAVDPIHPGTVYTASDRLYKSVNFGGLWVPVNDGLEGRRVLSLAIASLSDSLLYAGTDAGVFRSADGAARWEPKGLSDRGVFALQVDPTNPFVAYAGTDAGVYKTLDGGAHWAALSLPGGSVAVQSLAVAGADPRTLYAWITSGVVRSTDGGASWKRVSTGLPRSNVMALAPGAASDGADIFSAGSSVFRTRDGGGSWTDPGNRGLTEFLWTLVRDPIAGETLYAGGRGVFRTTDGAASWTSLGLVESQISVLAVDPRRPSVIYAGTFQNNPYGGTGIQKTSDGGATWHDADTGLPADAFVFAFAFDPAASNTLYAAVNDYKAADESKAGVYKTSNGGGTWAPTGLQTAVHTLAFDTADRPTLYAGTNGGVSRSRDGGANWAAFTNGLVGLPVLDLAVDPAHLGTIYAGTGSGVFRSTNDGEGWQPLNSGLDSPVVNALLIAPSGKTLYAAGYGVYAFTLEGPSVTLPAVASLHGIPPAYFHSDVSVFNASADEQASVVATYRCLSGSCPATERTFTVPPRQVRVFEDIVATLFERPETGGAVEFQSSQEIVVTSRLYTPARPAPTLGMFVPGLRGEQAYPKALLSSLSRSSDPGAGFRTNVGVYNGNDIAQLVRFSFVGSDGAALGEVSRLVPPRQGLQINDGDLPLAGAGDLPGFTCFVEGDGESPLFAYGVVLDNQSQDAIFVPGRDAAAPLGHSLTLSAAASLHGAGGSFFHSDVTVVNPTASAVSVSALYHCGLGVCQAVGQNVERSFDLGPGEFATFEDIVATLFGAPETAGVVVLRTLGFGRLVATSRLFTPSRPEPTVGMFVPALDQFESTAAAVLTSLTRSVDTSRGARVNVGVFNDFSDGQDVTFRVFRGDGMFLGQISRLLGPQASVQINDVFGAIGIAGDVPSAYCLVQGDKLGPIYAYAAVIDNQSQDPIFVPGQNDPEPPPPALRAPAPR